jgi:uncharacterized protein (TIGR02145 family)
MSDHENIRDLNLNKPYEASTLSKLESHVETQFNSGNYDWRGTVQNNNLWQAESGINTPCPLGYRLPTDSELNTLITNASIWNPESAANTKLKFQNGT